MEPGKGDRSSGNRGVGDQAPSLAVGSPNVTGTEPAVRRPHVPSHMVWEREKIIMSTHEVCASAWRDPILSLGVR